MLQAGNLIADLPKERPIEHAARPADATLSLCNDIPPRPRDEGHVRQKLNGLRSENWPV